jgi:hypothetical protein
MELSEDDLGHFEFALRFVYTQFYDNKAIEDITGKDEKFKKMQFVMGLYTIADKYEIVRLKIPAVQDFKCLLRKARNERVLKSVIEAHYQHCSVPKHTIGASIASITIDVYREFVRTAASSSLLVTFPVFASDMALQYHVEGYFNAYLYHCECGQTLLFREPRGSKWEVTIGNCSGCEKSCTHRF